MPKFVMETTHSLGKDEARRRLQKKFNAARVQFGDHVSDFDEQWNDGSLSFGFKAMGMKVAGTVEVGEEHVKLDASLPLAAMMFKGAIEQRIREEFGNLLT